MIDREQALRISRRCVCPASALDWAARTIFYKDFPSKAAPGRTKYLTDHRLGLKVMAHFCASFRLHVARGRGAIVSLKVGPRKFSIQEKLMPTWTQIYDPFGHWWLSALVAGLPIVVLFTMMAGFRVKPHWAALSGAATAVLVACLAFHMPISLAAGSFLYGVSTGLLNIVWIVVAPG